MQDRNEALLRQLLERYAEGGGVGEPYARPLGDFYASCMDLAGIERGGLAAADPHLAMAAAVKDGSSFSRAAGILATFGIWAPFSVSVEPDMQDATRTMLYLEQGGLSLPDRDVYVGREEHQVKVLAEYFNHVTRMFQLLGDEETAARRSATAVVRLETALAEATRRPDEMRDPRSLYHPTRREELAATMGSFDGVRGCIRRQRDQPGPRPGHRRRHRQRAGR